jgi:hypothetical protein
MFKVIHASNSGNFMTNEIYPYWFCFVETIREQQDAKK